MWGSEQDMGLGAGTEADMFQHVGVAIDNEGDIEKFYRDVLGLEPVKRFEVDPNLSERLFGIGHAVSVAVLSRGDFTVELFLSDVPRDHGYSHIGISVPNRDGVMKRAEAGGFSVTHIERESKPVLLFIRDGSGNAFEVKEE
jgi:catechol 2,3-dioxygenase-like lactoylglutathione lyase family enzyme